MTNENTDRFWDAMSSLKDGQTLENVKFFVGANREVTQAALCEQSANAMRQIELGTAKSVECFDRDIKTALIKDFI